MTRDPNNLAFMNVLWKHYEKMRQFGAAAQILTKLAERSIEGYHSVFFYHCGTV